MKKLLLSLLIISLPIFTYADDVIISKSNITNYDVYTDWGNGDVVFYVNNMPITTDAGFYLAGENGGTKATFASIINALNNGNSLRVFWENSEVKWDGSSTVFRRATMVRVLLD